MDSDRMLASLRQTFTTRIPGGLTDTAESRLRRALQHFTKEVTRARGAPDEQEILRETYESMAAWYRRNTDQIQVNTGRMDGEVDNPFELFDRFRAPAPAPGGIAELPPILRPLETSTRSPRATNELSMPIERVPVQQKDILQRQENVVKYREVEYNLILNSKDRNWLVDTKQNRYAFSVVLDAAVRAQGTGAQATIMNRFRNIVRVELVKTLLPVEALDVVVDCSENSQSGFYSVMALPSIHVHLDEHQGNNFGTNDGVDRSLGICQYDATWRSDTFQHTTALSRGYTLFIPKFLKAQRVYAPTPLSNFQRLSFQILDPQNQLLSKAPDASHVSRVLRGDIPDVSSGGCYASADYLFIETKEWFPTWAYSKVDKILFAGLTGVTGQLLEWIQRIEGHFVLDVAYTDGASVLLGGNECGWANWIIIRNRFTDPTAAGSCTLDYFTGDAGTDATLFNTLADYPPIYQEGGVLNLSRQVQVVLRIVTREMDSATNIRPDNV